MYTNGECEMCALVGLSFSVCVCVCVCVCVWDMCVNLMPSNHQIGWYSRVTIALDIKGLFLFCWN